MLNRRKTLRRRSAALLSGILFVLTGCPPQTPSQVNPIPPVNVNPIPTSIPITIGSTPAPSPGIALPPNSANTAPEPGPTQAPSLPGTGNEGQLSISDLSLPTAVLDFNYLHPMRATGGTGAYRWSLFSGTLPNGLILDQATGQIFGKPTQTGTFNFEIQLIDSNNSQAVRRQFFILVSDTNSGLNDLGVLTDDLPSGAVDVRYSQTLEVSGGTPPYSWDIQSGSLPDGLELNTSTGEISGTPTLQGEETFTVRVVDARGQVGTETLSITINSTSSDLTISTKNLPIGIAGESYNRDNQTVCGNKFSGKLRATGGDNDFNWDISSGTLPPGLELDGDEIIGTLDVGSEGAYTFTVKVQDGDDNSASRVFTIQVESLLIHSFTPTSGSEGLIVTLRGEGLNGATVEFPPGGGDFQFASADIPDDGSCEQITVATPEGATNGLLKAINGGGEGLSLLPFLINDIAINEIFTNPDASGNQFVELLNKGPTTVGLAGWSLMYTNSSTSANCVDPSTNAGCSVYTLPAEAPVLAPGETTVININKSGGNSASNLYTGTALPKMLFTPIDTLSSGSDSVDDPDLDQARTEIALCAGSVDIAEKTCSTETIRDFVEFGGGTTASSLHTTAADAGIWDSDTDVFIDTTDMMANIDDDLLETVPSSGSTAHYGVSDGTTNQGILLHAGGASNFEQGDSVVIETFNSVPVSRRTITDFNGQRILIDSALNTKTISSSNTGNGLTGNGILVNNITNLTVGDYLNVIAGGIVNAIANLTTAPAIELDSLVSAEIDWETDLEAFPEDADGYVVADNLNYDDGVGTNNLGTDGLLFENVTPLVGANSINITINGDTSDEFTVTRTVSNIDTDTNRIKITQPVLSTDVLATSQGDGTAGNPIIVEDKTNFLDDNIVLINKVPRTIKVVSSTDGDAFELDCPIQMQIAATNTGTGTDDEPLLVTFNGSQGPDDGNTTDMDAAPDTCMGLANNNRSSFDTGDILKINKTETTISSITTVSGQTRVELAAPLSMDLVGGENFTGAANFEFRVGSTENFVVGDQVSLGPVGHTEVCTISAILQAPNRIRCNEGPIIYAQDTGEDPGDGITEPLTLTDVDGLMPETTLRFDVPVYDLTTYDYATSMRGTVTGNITEVRNITDVDYDNNQVFLATDLLETSISEPLIAPAGDGSAGSLLNVNDITGFLDDDYIKIVDGPNTSIAQIETITPGGIANEGTIQLTASTVLDNPTGLGATITLVRNDIANIYLGTGTFYPTVIQAGLNLIPKAGTVSLVPTALKDPGTDFVSFVPTEGSIFFAPTKGTVKKYLSIKYRGEGNTVADFTCDTPNPGTDSISSSSAACTE